MTRRSYANFEKKLTSGLKKDMRIWQIFTRAPESVKIGCLMGSFVKSRKGMTLKVTEELCVMAIRNNVKFEKELDFPFKTDMRNLKNFDSSTPKSKKKISLICSLILRESFQVR